VRTTDKKAIISQIQVHQKKKARRRIACIPRKWFASSNCRVLSSCRQ
jgi:hypothetical protein